MAIAFDAVSVSTALNNANTSRTWSHTVGSGSDRVLLVGTRVRDANAQNQTLATAVTYNGTSLTLYREYALLSSGLGEYLGVQWWRLVAPPSGAANVVVTWGNGVPQQGGAVAISLSGVGQATPLEAFGETNGTGSLTTVASVTTLTAEAWVVSNVYSGATSATLNAGPTQRDQTAYGSDYGASATTATTSTGSVTHTWTNTAAEAGDYIGLAVSVVAAAAPSSSSPAFGRYGVRGPIR